MLYESIYDHLEEVGKLDEYIAAMKAKDIDSIRTILTALGYDPEPYVIAVLKWGANPNPKLL